MDTYREEANPCDALRTKMTHDKEHRFAALLAFAFIAAGCSANTDSEETQVLVQDELRQAFAAADEVNVILNLRGVLGTEAGLGRHRASIREIRERVVKDTASGLVLTHRYNDVPAIAGRLSRASVEALSKHPNVESIQIDGIGHGALKLSVPAIGGDVAQKTYGVTGKGVTVAVLDTGVNTAHRDLTSSVSSTQYCVTHSACPPNNTSTGTSALDDHGHGSHVTGIIASDGVVAGLGFAPGASIVSVKINDSTDSGYVSDWISGLQWIYDNLATLKVKVINMSICTTTLYSAGTSCDSGQPALAVIVNKLVAAGVTIFAASGNNGSSTQLSAPACLTGVIAVGATYKSNQGRQPSSGSYSQWGGFGNCSDASTTFDQVTCFTNSNSRLDLVAPGAVVESDYSGSTSALSEYRGTSQASPAAAGVAALMLECSPNLAPAQLKSLLISTASTVTDPKNGLSFPSIRAEAAVKAACGSMGGASSTGGASAKGGASSTGGASAKGGASSTGGASAKGGATGSNTTSSGGASSTGGASAKGGATGSNTTSSGGASNTGGASSTGGATAKGGATGSSTTSSGGASSTGGATAKGGATGSSTSSSGGASNTGGAVAQGGAMGSIASSTSSSSTIATPTNDTGEEEGGCSCRIAEGPSGERSRAVPFLAMLLALSVRRRRGDSQPSA